MAKAKDRPKTPADQEPEAQTSSRAEAEGVLGVGPVLGRKVRATAPEGCSPRDPGDPRGIGRGSFNWEHRELTYPYVMISSLCLQLQ
jgi:hypothetical protein